MFYSNCFTVTVALNHKETSNHSERKNNTKKYTTPFIKKYKWKGRLYPSERRDWGKRERNSQTKLCIFYLLMKGR